MTILASIERVSRGLEFVYIPEETEVVGGIHVGTTVELTTDGLSEFLSVTVNRVYDSCSRFIGNFGSSNGSKRLHRESGVEIKPDRCNAMRANRRVVNNVVCSIIFMIVAHL